MRSDRAPPGRLSHSDVAMRHTAKKRTFSAQGTENVRDAVVYRSDNHSIDASWHFEAVFKGT